jgi:hypothetical protein
MVNTDAIRIYFVLAVMIGELCYLPGFQIHFKKVGTVLPVAPHEDLFASIVPARVGKIEVITILYPFMSSFHLFSPQCIANVKRRFLQVKYIKYIAKRIFSLFKYDNY